MPLEVNTVLRNRYRIEETLDEGGMGAVYRAYDINLGVAVAVKENLFSTDEYARQFRREATILASLRHGNLPRVTDHFVLESQGQYLVMDFVEGEDLRERLERTGPVPEQEALPWFLEISDALSYLHTRVPPILHRDVKPGNIKITPDGRAILVDFGLAKEVREDTTTTSTGAKAMTPGFSPPEQYGTGRTDARTDTYSLGATMYAALTAAVPEDALERAMGRTKLTPVRTQMPTVSPAVARAIERSLEINAEDRYQTVAEFGAALASSSKTTRPTMVRNYPHLERTLVSSGRTRVSVPTKSTLKRQTRRWPTILLLLVILSAVLAGVIYAQPEIEMGLARVFGQISRPSASLALPTDSPTSADLVIPSRTVGPLAVAPSATPTTQQQPTATSEPTESPTPQVAHTSEATPTGGGVGQLAFASNRTGIPQLFLINVDGEGLTQLTTLPDGACQPSWSPDGMRLVFTSPCRGNRERYPGSSLWIIDVDGTNLEPLPTAPGGDYDPAWSPEGERIAFTSLRDNRPQIYILNLGDSSVVNLSENSARESQPAWSPSGTQVMYVSRRAGPSEIWFMPDFGGLKQPFSLSGGRDDSYPDWSGNGFVLFEQAISNVPRLVATRFEDRGAPEFRICPEGPLSVQPMAEARWSPDGRWILFETWPTGDNHDIALIAESCTNYARLTSDPAIDFDPAWRP